MALANGTNCGFVSAAPVDDPNDVISGVANYSVAFRDTSPVGSYKVTEIGWYQSNVANSAAAYECAIYQDDGADDPGDLLSAISTGQNTTANTVGWYKYTALTINLTSNTTYWIGLAHANATGSIDVRDQAGEKRAYKGPGNPTLPSPWGASSGSGARMVGVYALYEAGGPSGPTRNEIRRRNQFQIQILKYWPVGIAWAGIKGSIDNPRLTRREMANPFNWMKKNK